MNHRFALLTVFALVLSASAQQKSAKRAASAEKPDMDSQLYRNPAFGFRFRIPYGWVDRTKEMREDNESGRGEVLLAVFERPPQAAGDTVNSAVVIAAESAASYPGLKSAEDYLGPLTGLTTSKGFKAAGDPSVIEIDARQLVRADFTKPLNTKLSMHQSTLALLVKGQIVSFTFIAGSEEEVSDLIQELAFTPPKSRSH
jgi:hypothetical protein